MMIDKRLIAAVPETRRLIPMKTLVSWLSLLIGVFFWFSAACILG